MKDRTDLIHRALRNLGVLPQGTAPNAEEYQSVSDLVDGVLAELNARDIIYIPSADLLEEEFLQPLGHILAWRAAPEFGAAADQALAALAEQAELRTQRDGHEDNTLALHAIHADRLSNNLSARHIHRRQHLEKGIHFYGRTS